ncbi:DUF1772 domain-containing protein [Amycolatopsis sp. lyj-90]|uniref:anthrone oxygenase family protein n=1 Tax=Amycolatopsis sp. lyj-90 TaxID=2789285 RepID=UPI00397C9344
MLADILSVVALVGSGLVAGVLFAVALSVLPALIAMPAGDYIRTHQLIGRNWDPTMPVLVLSSAAADIALAFVESAGTVHFGVASALLLGVSVVSHWCNVPINRVVKSLDPRRIPPGWRDPRPLWRRWHLLRTTLAVLAVFVNAFAVTVIR